MTNVNDISLGLAGAENLLSPFGRTFTQGYLEGARADRTASFRGVKDIYGIKKTFTLKYEIVDNDVLEIIKTAYELEQELSLIVQELTGPRTYAVTMQPFNWDRLLAVNGGLWTGPSIILEEV